MWSTYLCLPPLVTVNQARRIDFCQRDFRLNTESIDALILSLLFFSDVYTNSTQKQHYFELKTAFYTLKGQGIDRCCWVETVSLSTVVCRLRQAGDATLGLAINNKHVGRVRSHFSVIKRSVSACCNSRTIEFHWNISVTVKGTRHTMSHSVVLCCKGIQVTFRAHVHSDTRFHARRLIALGLPTREPGSQSIFC